MIPPGFARGDRPWARGGARFAAPRRSPVSSPARPLPADAPLGVALPGIRLRDGFALREGQRIFLERWAELLRGTERNALGVFVPGYGKTITALASYVVARALGIADRLVVFVP